MRHNRDEKRFDMTWSHLRSVLANMASDLIRHGRIKTTTSRAKALRRYAERMITLGKDGSVAARRRAMAFLRSKDAVTRLFADLAPQFKERNGGYTRILKLGVRPGDNAKIALIEYVGSAPSLDAAAVKPAKQRIKKTPSVKERPAHKMNAGAKQASQAKKLSEKKSAPKKGIIGSKSG
ncbi:MAG: 50S ribosomal protein L17 [Deltaproteobacteria bacterium]|nr:50S ribosomal protein L17 [Deltaproteobacteria bacterium]